MTYLPRLKSFANGFTPKEFQCNEKNVLLFVVVPRGFLLLGGDDAAEVAADAEATRDRRQNQ